MSKTILLIEDDEHLRAIYAQALSGRGYQILAATNGAEGVHLARRRRPSLILLDIRMPVMDGWTTLSYLRSLDETKRIPVCAISARAPSDEERERVGRRDVSCYLVKPVDPKDLIALVESRVGPAAGRTLMMPEAH